MYNRVILVVSQEMEELNEKLQLGGNKIQCEADEIALRSVAGLNSEREAGVWWIRWFGLLKRGCSKIYLKILEDRFVKNAG